MHITLNEALDECQKSGNVLISYNGRFYCTTEYGKIFKDVKDIIHIKDDFVNQLICKTNDSDIIVLIK